MENEIVSGLQVQRVSKFVNFFWDSGKSNKSLHVVDTNTVCFVSLSTVMIQFNKIPVRGKTDCILGKL